jgi:acetolactate synthase-1/2/3 large subunit
MVRVADYIVHFLEKKGIKHVFTVTGGGAMFLNDGLAKSTNIKGIFNHHEQACAMAAVAYSKVNNKIAVVMPTTGCGGTNTITGLLDAWQDSNKVVFISGNVNKKETQYCTKTPLRKFGVQEANIVEIVKSITKYAVMITQPNTIAYHLEKAFYLCENERPGPVWLDIPLDIQGSYINGDELEHFDPSELGCSSEVDYKIFEQYLKESKRPIVIVGYGVHLANAREEFVKFIEKYQLPTTFTYLGIDLLPSDHPLYVGRLGTKGDRAGNFAVQNSDLIISLGSSLSVSVTGFRYDTFAREAKKVVIDIDKNEHKKNTINIDCEINADVKKFMRYSLDIDYRTDKNWVHKCIGWRDKWPVFNELYKDTTNGINIYYFLHELSKKNKPNAITISDAGSAFYTTSQALQIKQQQKYITSGGQADMGFTLPASIGVSFASPNNKNIIGITGDGSFQMNIQELQTITNFNLPIKIFVLNNGGYLSIRNTMDKFFESRYYGTDGKSGLTFPEIEKIAYAYDIPYYKLRTSDDLNFKLEEILDLEGYALIEVVCPFKQDIIPSSSSKQNSEGKLISQPLENMFPFLSEDEFENEMIIKNINK